MAALDDSLGTKPGFRAAHAKGVCCEAHFTATPEAARLTRAAHMAGGRVPAVVRFSNSSVRPDAPDYALETAGMAVKFLLPGGQETDIVAINLPVFFVRRPEDFIEFTMARRPDSRTGRPSNRRIAAFALRHPESLRALVHAARRLQEVMPSFLDSRYFGLHAFRWLDGVGGSRFVRYEWHPEAGERAIPRTEARARGRDFLGDELAARLEGGPAAFRLEVQIADPGDRTDDATHPWPRSRRRAVVGRLELERIVDDQAEGCERRVFDPTRITDGIELSDDPLLEARRAAYSVSIERRLK